MHGNLARLHELLRARTWQHLAIPGCQFIGMGCDNRGRLDQFIDDKSRFFRARREGITDVHDCQLHAVVLPDNAILLCRDTGVSGEIYRKTVADVTT